MPASVGLAGEEFKTQKELNHRFHEIALHYAPCHWDIRHVNGEDLDFLQEAILYNPYIEPSPYDDAPFVVDYNSHMSLSVYVDGENINYSELTRHIFRAQRNGLVVRRVPADYFGRAWDALSAKSSTAFESHGDAHSDVDTQESLDVLEQLARQGKDIRFSTGTTSSLGMPAKTWYVPVARYGSHPLRARHTGDDPGARLAGTVGVQEALLSVTRRHRQHRILVSSGAACAISGVSWIE